MTEKIKVGFFTDEINHAQLNDCDVLLAGFRVFKSASFKNELSGKSKVLSEIGRLSKLQSGIVFAGVETDNYGIIRTSIAVSENSKIIGISDETHVDKHRSAGFGYRIYNTKKGRFGVLVGNDLFVDGAAKTLSECECSAIIAISPSFCDFNAEILVQAIAYLNGIAICFLNDKTVYCASSRGELVYKGEENGNFQLSLKAEYREYVSKSRGLCKKTILDGK